MDSILDSIKKLLGIDEEYKHFDIDIIMHINTVFMTLHQLGIGPDEGYAIVDSLNKWTDYIPEMELEPRYECIKTYMYRKVRLAFDPPQSSSAVESLNRLIAEDEWRISVLADQIRKEEEENQNEE